MQVPDRVGQHCVLEVDQPHPALVRPLRHPDQVLGVIIAVRDGPRLLFAHGDDRRPGGPPLLAGLGSEFEAGVQPRHPFDEQVRPALQRHRVIGQQGPVAGGALHDVGQQGGHVQPGDGVHCGQIERRLRLALGEHAGEQVVAEILNHRQAVGRVHRHDLRRRQARVPEMLGHRREGLDPAGRQTGDRVPASGAPLIRRPGGMARRRLRRGRLVHQHQRGPGRRGQTLVAARRGVAGQGRARGLAEPGGREKVATQLFPVRHAGPLPCSPTPLRQKRSHAARRPSPRA